MIVLNSKEISEVSGAISIEKLLFSVTVGALFGAMRGVGGGPAGMCAGAIMGASMAATGCMTSDAYEIKSQLGN